MSKTPKTDHASDCPVGCQEHATCREGEEMSESNLRRCVCLAEPKESTRLFRFFEFATELRCWWCGRSVQGRTYEEAVVLWNGAMESLKKHFDNRIEKIIGGKK